MLYVSVLCCLAALGAASGKLLPVCEPSPAGSSASGPKLPELPSAFSTLIEFNIVKENYTAVHKESYDQKADKGRLSRRKNGTMHVDIYDYTLDEIIHLDDEECTVSSASNMDVCHLSLFDFGAGAHIESVTQLFKFGKEFNESYMGVSYVRGIRCHHWRACITAANISSYYLDYYFSVPEWETPWGIINSTVVRAVVNGTSVNGKCNNGTWSVLNGTHDFYNVYDFIDFRPFPPDPVDFQIPDGVYCEGLKGNKTAPKLPPVFSMDFEWTSNRYNRVMSWQETYDVKNRLAMFKHPDWWKPSFGLLTEIHDFNRGIGYNISRHHTGATCNLFNLTVRKWDVTLDGSRHIRMKTAQELFFSFGPTLNSSSPVLYKGSAAVRGVNADIWVGKAVWKRGNQTHQVVDQWYFARPNWRVESLGFDNVQHQVPLRRDFFLSRDGHAEHDVMSVFNFNPVAAEPALFDIRPCFTLEEQRLVWFSLRDPQGRYEKYVGSKDFIPSLTKAISVAANVTMMRLNGMRLVDNRKEELVVSFILLDRTKAIGADVGVVYPEKGLLDALDAMNNSVNYGKFKLQFGGGTLNAVKSSFGVGFPTSVPPPSSYPAPPTPSSRPQPGKGEHKKGISSGAAAGISITMLIVGIAGGLLIAHVIMKRRGTSLFQYQRQE